MRPNLMSPRRTATSGEDSILAMLEREPARKRKAGTSGIRLAWYGASATLALALTGTLIWMAANNDGLRPEVQESVLAEAEQAPRRSAPVPGDSPAGAATILQVAMAPASAAPDTQPAGAALIVDQAPPAEAVPPLRLLKSAPEKPAAETSMPPAARASAVSPVPAAAAPPRSVAKASHPARPAAPAKPRQVVAAKSAVKPAQAKAQRGVNPAKGPEAPVDADVALISAVIVHANGHAPEGSQMTELLCPNNACQSRPPSQ
ncbi:hypothetical protein [Massilia alkalitolerans]|uniref:hypothetical protein n=1 Tax=Massilia alkalitolerans TaxID=286638 RepID=UPI0028AD6536|nr:hypothetical protein [Massilia alkalitolerans]